VSSTASATPAVPPTTEPAPVELTEPAHVFVASPDALASDEHGVWVMGANSVTLFDPSSLEPVMSVRPGDEPCQGIGVGFGSVWACSNTGVARLDPTTGDVIARLDVNKAQAQQTIASDFGRVWVLLNDGSSVAAIDPETNQVADTFELPARGTELTTGDVGLWIVSALDDAVMRIDPDTGEVLVTVDLNNPTSASVTDAVWVGASTETVRLDPETGAILVDAPYGTGADGMIAVDGASVWVRRADAFLTRLDATTGELVESIPDDATSGGSVIVAHGRIWATAYNDATLFIADTPTT
jgi:streptogramin lyase